MKIAIKLVLTTVIMLLAYFLWTSISKPIAFENLKTKRYKASIKKLKDIRTAQLAYLAVNAKYASSFDTLINFVKNDSIPMVKAIGSVPDSLTEKEALKLKIISRDTSYVSTLDSLFSKDYVIDSLAYIPYTKGDKFFMDAAILHIGSKVSGSTLNIPVFEAKALNETILQGLNDQYRINLDDEALKMDKYPGLKVGSLITNINNAGNWE